MSITLSGTTITMNDGSTITSVTTYNAVGSYLNAANFGSAVAVGGTVAGSSLRHYNASRSPYFPQELFSGPGPLPGAPIAVSAMSGTYRNMNYQRADAGTTANIPESGLTYFASSFFGCRIS